MNKDEFVGRVMELAEIGTRDEAERVIRATLSTLRERLAGNEPRNLGAQLPGDLGEALDGEGGRDNFSLEEFYERVAEKEGVGVEKATVHARAVAATLQTAVTTGEMDNVRGQLKPEYSRLFGQQGGGA